ncbi:MAG: hypothetical protein QOF48_1009 [Verrucomicrobiota bacterium]|jgi:hypothetical protein
MNSRTRDTRAMLVIQISKNPAVDKPRRFAIVRAPLVE